jgi:hypothetical protein
VRNWLDNIGLHRYNVLVRNQKGRGHLEDSCVDGRKILKWILRKLGGSVWTEFMWLRNQWQDLVNTAMNLAGSIKGREFLD